jgi:hypothetical protein
MGTDIHTVPADELERHCEERSLKMRQQRLHGALLPEDYCIELLRRACETENELERNYYLNRVYKLYQQIWSRGWIRDPATFDQHPLTAEDFKFIAFVNVYEQIKGPQFRTFFRQYFDERRQSDAADSFAPQALNSFLAYTRKSVIRNVAAYFRSPMSRDARARSTEATDEDSLEQIAAEQDVQNEVENKLLWQDIDKRIADTLPDEEDRFFFDCWAKQDLTRAEIVQKFTDRWTDRACDENAVRVALQRVRRHLVKDQILRDLLKQYIGHSVRSDSSND